MERLRNLFKVIQAANNIRLESRLWISTFWPLNHYAIPRVKGWVVRRDSWMNRWDNKRRERLGDGWKSRKDGRFWTERNGWMDGWKSRRQKDKDRRMNGLKDGRT